MKGSITKYRSKKTGRISWGWYYKIKDKQFTKQGYDTKDEACDALAAEFAQKGLASAPSTNQYGTVAPRKGDVRTLAEYFGYWLDNHAALRCQPKTLERYRELANYMVRHLGSVPVCDLKARQIQDAVNALLLRGGAPTEKHPEGRPLAPKTVRSIASLLYTLLGDAVRMDDIPLNPMADRRVKLPPRVKREPTIADPAALAVIFRAAEGTRLYPVIVTDVSSGCRRGELCALTWADVDFGKGVMKISKSLEQTKAGLRVKSTKSGQPRIVGLDDFALEVLRAHHEEQAKDKINFGSGYRDHGLVFCQPNGEFYSPDRLGARIKELFGKVGYPGLTMHSLRHTHASILLGSGTPVAVVSERLGHADQNITLGVYSHSLPADRKAASKVWETALSDVISEGRAQNLGKSRKKTVND